MAITDYSKESFEVRLEAYVNELKLIEQLNGDLAEINATIDSWSKKGFGFDKLVSYQYEVLGNALLTYQEHVQKCIDDEIKESEALKASLKGN